MKKLFLIQPNLLLRKFYPKAVWNLERNEKIIYLTFDDGPVPGLSEWVLDELEKFNAKATFFCVGANIQRHPEVFSRIKADGHLVANHTMHHNRGFSSPSSTYLAEADECRSLVGNDLFRPPYGQLKPAQYKGLLDRGYKIIFWDVISYDFERIPEKKCAQNVLNNATNGSIVLFHDNVKAEKNLKYALPIFLKQFSRKGFSFKSLPV